VNPLLAWSCSNRFSFPKTDSDFTATQESLVGTSLRFFLGHKGHQFCANLLSQQFSIWNEYRSIA